MTELEEIRLCYRKAREELLWWNKQEWEKHCDYIGVQRMVREFNKWTDAVLKEEI